MFMPANQWTNMAFLSRIAPPPASVAPSTDNEIAAFGALCALESRLPAKPAERLAVLVEAAETARRRGLIHARRLETARSAPEAHGAGVRLGLAARSAADVAAGARSLVARKSTPPEFGFALGAYARGFAAHALLMHEAEGAAA